MLYGLTLHEFDPHFRLDRLIQIPVAFWANGAWQITGGTVTQFEPDGDGIPRELEPAEIEIADAPTEFRRKRRKSYEFDFLQLRKQIAVLKSKGLDANEYIVDLHHKIAVPFSGFIGVGIGLALIMRGGRRGGLGYNIGLAMVVVFLYWVTMAVCISAGHAGNLPPIVAAWTANLLFASAAGILYLTKRS